MYTCIQFLLTSDLWYGTCVCTYACVVRCAVCGVYVFNLHRTHLLTSSQFLQLAQQTLGVFQQLTKVSRLDGFPHVCCCSGNAGDCISHCHVHT